MTISLVKLASLGALAAALACGGGGAGGEAGGTDQVTKTVGPAGGTVSLGGGPTLVFPPGAVASNVAVTIRRSGSAPPARALGPLYLFGPDATSLAVPVVVSFPVPQGTTAATIFWTKTGSATDYDALPTALSGTTATAAVNHFSGGYVGQSFAELAECTADGASRMFALLEAFHGILRHVTFYDPLPAGVVETAPNAYQFPARSDLATATARYTTAPYPVGTVGIFHWTLAQQGRAEATGEGQFSFERLGASRLQILPTGTAAPWFAPGLDCRVVTDNVGFFASFRSEEALRPDGSLFHAVAQVGNATLDGWGNVGFSGVASMTGTFLGVPYAYEVDLHTGAVSY